MRQCRVTSCGAPTASRFSSHCRKHKSHLRRQGDTDQTAIRKSELTPYCSRVRSRIAKNDQNPLWDHLGDTWTAIVSDARTNANRLVQNRYERKAANMIVGIDGDTPPREIIITTAAMFMLLTERPTRFTSDGAFRLQLAKRVLGLSRANTGLRYDHATGSQKRVHREIGPKAAAIFGRKLAVAFGPLGLRLAKLEKRDAERIETMTSNIRNALRELT